MATLSKSVTLVEFKRSLVPPKWEESVRVSMQFREIPYSPRASLVEKEIRVSCNHIRTVFAYVHPDRIKGLPLML